MKMRPFALGICLLSLSGCLENLGESLHLQLESGFTDAQKLMLQGDLVFLKRTQTIHSEGTYAKAFGTTALAINQYLDERVHYLIPPTVDIGERTWLKSTPEKNTPVLVAQNVGTDLFMTRLQNYYDFRVLFSLGATSVEVDSPRVGIIQLGEGFFTALKSSVTRLGTLVHEARHSDCTGGISDEDLARALRKLDIKNEACGHVHEICPSGHAFAGLYACESHPWGAYAIESVFLTAVARNCAGCSEEEKQIAAAASLDRLSRVLIDQSGDPDMTSFTFKKQP